MVLQILPAFSLLLTSAALITSQWDTDDRARQLEPLERRLHELERVIETRQKLGHEQHPAREKANPSGAEGKSNGPDRQKRS
jgi:hypothetical protein